MVQIGAEIVDGLSSAAIEIAYDPALLDAVDCNINTVMFPSGLCNEKFEHDGKNLDSVRFNVTSVTANVVGEIKLVTIEFDILDGPLDSDFTPVLDVKVAADVHGQSIPITVAERQMTAVVETDRQTTAVVETERQIYLPVIHK